MATAPLVSEAAASTATLANVASSATSVVLFAANEAARGRIVYNDSTALLYIKFGATASTSSFTMQVAANGGSWTFPAPCYSGLVHAIWASANGNARTTELSG